VHGCGAVTLEKIKVFRSVLLIVHEVLVEKEFFLARSCSLANSMNILRVLARLSLYNNTCEERTYS
jgi:hypothetical protein